MIKEKKFIQLKTITRQKKVAEELLKLRDFLISENSEVEIDFLILKTYFTYYENNKTLLEVDNYIFINLKELLSLLNKYDKQTKRLILEKTHYLYHEIMETIGYPISEKQFIQKTGDNTDLGKDEIISNKSELVLVLDNLRSAFNVGSIIRLADCLGIKEIFALGLTPDIKNEKVIKTSKDSDKYVTFTAIDDFNKLLQDLKSENYKIVAIETAENSIDLNDFIFTKKTALILGNEEIGVSQEILNTCDAVVEIDMKGYKRSLNVSNATGIVIFEYNKQLNN